MPTMLPIRGKRPLEMTTAIESTVPAALSDTAIQRVVAFQGTILVTKDTFSLV